METALLQNIFSLLGQGVDIGYQLPGVMGGQQDLLRQLRYNAAVFSIFKKHDFDTQIVALLIDEQGQIRSRDSFIQEAAKISTKHLKQWFRTEYDQAIGTANMARKWRDFQGNKDLYPHLEYKAVMDDRTRPQHRAWDGIILPIDHPFWNTHYPPNDWGCRCDAVQTDKPVASKGLLVNDMAPLPKMFNMNAGKAGVIFDISHPYFKVPDPDQVHGVGAALMLGQQKRILRNMMAEDDYQHQDLGSIQVGKRGIEKTHNLNSNKDTLYLVLVELPDLQYILNELEALGDPEPPSRRKGASILHYRRAQYKMLDGRTAEVYFEKDNSITEDYKFYGMRVKK